MATKAWNVSVPFSASKRIRDIVSREETLDNINSKVATETTLQDVFRRSDFTETRKIIEDQVGLAKESTLSEIQGHVEDLDSAVPALETDGNGLLQAVIESGSIDVSNVGDFFQASDFTEARNVRELQNETGVASGQDTGGGSLSTQDVPDGSHVRVQALQGNDSIVQVDGNFELVAGQAVNLGVDDVSKISYTANAGEGVCWIVES